MKTASNVSRVLSAAMAAACSLGLLAAVAQHLDPGRLAVNPQVVQWERVVVTAPAPAPTVAAAQARTASN
jgi:hypothetical protein